MDMLMWSITLMLGILLGELSMMLVMEIDLNKPFSMESNSVIHPSDKAKEYVDQVNEHYNYNIDNLYTRLTDDELKEQGGVCWHYADYYVKMASKDSLYAERVDFTFNKGESHAVTIISNEIGYCVLSNNLIVGCSDFG
jgi:hypothetical protein